MGWDGDSLAEPCHAPVARRRWAARFSLLVLGKSRIERRFRRGKIEVPNESTGFGGTMLPIHAGVFPLNRQWAVVPGPIQRTDDLFERYVATTQRSEVPVSIAVSKRQMPPEYT